jgi:hypothetical protein
MMAAARDRWGKSCDKPQKRDRQHSHSYSQSRTYPHGKAIPNAFNVFSGYDGHGGGRNRGRGLSRSRASAAGARRPWIIAQAPPRTWRNNRPRVPSQPNGCIVGKRGLSCVAFVPLKAQATEIGHESEGRDA